MRENTPSRAPTQPVQADLLDHPTSIVCMALMLALIVLAARIVNTW